MYELQVGKMTCGGCANRVIKAVLSVDNTAKVDVDLHSKTVRVESVAGWDQVHRAITDAGYPVTASATSSQ